jgi:ribulose-5-phosphate 4-epimerase/fuculose-1-phosphate aldolase
MTPTGSSLGALDVAQLSRLDRDGKLVDGGVPTKELPLHLAMYDQHPDAQAIVHLHSTYAVAVACLENVDPDDVLPPLTPYCVMRVGRLVLVPYARPGSLELAEGVRRRARAGRALLLANHGPIVAGGSVDTACSVIEEVEESAKLVLLLQGLPIRRLSQAEVAALGQPS